MMYLKEFTDKVKEKLDTEGHEIADLDWSLWGWENGNKWREVFHEETGSIHYEFFRRYNNIHFEIHCHHLNQAKWNELYKDMIVIGSGKCIAGEHHDQPRMLNGSKTLTHITKIELNTRKDYEPPEIEQKVDEMTEIVKEMYGLYNRFILSNLKYF